MQFGQRQPSRNGVQPGPAARSSSGANLRWQRQQARAGRWDSGGMTHGSRITEAYEHLFEGESPKCVLMSARSSSASGAADRAELAGLVPALEAPLELP